MRCIRFLSILSLVALTGTSWGVEPSSVPLPTPLNRLEVKQALEDLKDRPPRIPLPELTAEEKAKLDERGSSYEGRLRSLYMPWSRSGARPAGGTTTGTTPAAGAGQNQDPKMTLDYAFKTELFWIVSRTNNCLY